MMRAEAYRRAGGYRTAFRYAQDWDLWLRLLELGELGCLTDLVYAWRVWAGALSATRGARQRHLRTLALACRDARAAGRPEQALLEDAARVSALALGPATDTDTAATAYFIGRCLARRGDPRCLTYLLQAWRLRPMQARAAVALLAAYLRFGSRAQRTRGQAALGPRP
jgi:hypothetical protein